MTTIVSVFAIEPEKLYDPPPSPRAEAFLNFMGIACTIVTTGMVICALYHGIRNFRSFIRNFRLY